MQKKVKKLIPYLLTLIILVGLFSPTADVDAQTTPGVPCTAYAVDGTPLPPGCDPSAGFTSNTDALQNNLEDCGVLVDGSLNGCLIKLTYYIFFGLAGFLLTLTASFVNVIIPLTLSSVMYTASDFIPQAWAIVRDLSNLFFILILLFVAIQTILGMGHDAKKTIVKIIIMALLINFSMFFSKVIIDSSNILALVFYNKINTEVTGPQGHIPMLDFIKTRIEDKDITGGLVASFNPTRFLTQDFFTKAKEKTQAVGMSTLGTLGWTYVGAKSGAAIGSLFAPIIGTGIGAVAGGGLGYGLSLVIGYTFATNEVPVPLMLGIIITAGLIMFFAAYSFFIVGLAFLSRLIELWVLIIFSPFAFMSSTIPLFQKMESIGWDGWIKRILKLSFFAPIFMFFLYLIFKLASINPFGGLAARSFKEQLTFEAMLFIIIPAMVILILLKKSTDYAKKASGELGEVVLKTVATTMGVAGGLALGGAARGLQATVGHAGSAMANSRWLKTAERLKIPGAGMLQGAATWAGKSEFDVRKGVLGTALGAVEGVTGLKYGAGSRILAHEGGYEADRAKAEKRRRERANQFEVSEDEPLKQTLNEFEQALQQLLHTHAERLHELDRNVTEAKENFDNTTGQAKEDAQVELTRARDERRDFKAATGITHLAREAIPEAKLAIEIENRNRKRAYAANIQGIEDNQGIPYVNVIRNFFRNIGFNTFNPGDSAASRRAAAHKIIMDAKIEEKHN